MNINGRDLKSMHNKESTFFLAYEMFIYYSANTFHLAPFYRSKTLKHVSRETTYKSADTRLATFKLWWGCPKSIYSRCHWPCLNEQTTKYGGFWHDQTPQNILIRHLFIVLAASKEYLPVSAYILYVKSGNIQSSLRILLDFNWFNRRSNTLYGQSLKRKAMTIFPS